MLLALEEADSYASDTMMHYAGGGANWFKARHRWPGRNYSPRAGDVIFFDYEGDCVLDHVGLVRSCDGKTVTTIALLLADFFNEIPECQFVIERGLCDGL